MMLVEKFDSSDRWDISADDSMYTTKLLVKKCISYSPLDFHNEEETNDENNINDWTHLFRMAVRFKHYKIILSIPSVYLEYIVNLNYFNDIFSEAVCNNDIEFIKHFIEPPINMDIVINYDGYRQSFVYMAVNKGLVDMVNLLLSSQNNKYNFCKLDTRNSEGETLLFKAVRREDITAIKTLLYLGIDISVKNNNGETALDLARYHESTWIVNNLLT